MNKQEKIDQFDPNGPAANDNLFGLPFSIDEAEVVVLPVPWEVTVSYAAGTANAPAAIKTASQQVDLYDPVVPDAWKMGIAMATIDEKLQAKSNSYRAVAKELIEDLDNAKSEVYREKLTKVNAACNKMVETIQQRCSDLLEEGKLVALLGGDHSTPLGYLKALAKQHSSFGILQIDAHADLRKAYEGFTYSHASIMYNALKLPQVSKLVQVGIRDYCQEEVDFINQNKERITTYFDRDLKHQNYRGKTWAEQVAQIIDQLPQKVYLSFDIDGLDPKLCPNTGTPVAGGFEAEQVLYLVEELINSGRTLIGFDLNEVSPGDGEWDANVGARILYQLCNLLGRSNGRI
jgi:agmatinase